MLLLLLLLLLLRFLFGRLLLLLLGPTVPTSIWLAGLSLPAAAAAAVLVAAAAAADNFRRERNDLFADDHLGLLRLWRDGTFNYNRWSMTNIAPYFPYLDKAVNSPGLLTPPFSAGTTTTPSSDEDETALLLAFELPDGAGGGF